MMITRIKSLQQKWGNAAMVGSLTGILLTLPFAFYIGVVGGGTLGGGLGWTVAGGPGVILGVLVGFTLVAGILLFLGAVIGYSIAWLFKGKETR